MNQEKFWNKLYIYSLVTSTLATAWIAWQGMVDTGYSIRVH